MSKKPCEIPAKLSIRAPDFRFPRRLCPAFAEELQREARFLESVRRALSACPYRPFRSSAISVPGRAFAEVRCSLTEDLSSSSSWKSGTSFKNNT